MFNLPNSITVEQLDNAIAEKAIKIVFSFISLA